MVLPIKNKVGWVLMRHQKQKQINEDNVHENSKIVDHDNKVGDKFVLDNYAVHKYEPPYKCINDSYLELTPGIEPRISALSLKDPEPYY